MLSFFNSHIRFLNCKSSLRKILFKIRICCHIFNSIFYEALDILNCIWMWNITSLLCEYKRQYEYHKKNAIYISKYEDS